MILASTQSAIALSEHSLTSAKQLAAARSTSIRHANRFSRVLSGSSARITSSASMHALSEHLNWSRSVADHLVDTLVLRNQRGEAR